ncbi:MAG: SGNH/GDSL hydrolase family protein [Planctomycetaceae bacterium]
MVRLCLGCFRRLLYALVLLALLGCLLEIALRVYDSATGQVTRRDLYDRGLVCKSWFAHHTLKPSRVFSVRNPDTDDRVRVTVNSWGLRGAEPACPKPAGLFRVLCLGDETTLGSQVTEAETFCARLEQELGSVPGRRVEVLNAGVPDYCPLLEYLQYRHHLQGLAPDLIIVNFDMSDVADDYAVRRFAAIGPDGLPVSCTHPGLELNRRGEKGGPRENPLLAPLWCRQRLNCLLTESRVLESGRSIEAARARYAWLEDQPPDWSVHIAHALEPLISLRDLAATRATPVLVVACPAPWQVSAAASDGEGVREQMGVGRDACYRSRRPFETLAEFCRRNRLEFCDLSPAFQQMPQAERLYLTHAAMYSKEGHLLHARELARYVAAHLSATSEESIGGVGVVPAHAEQPAPRGTRQ